MSLQSSRNESTWSLPPCRDFMLCYIYDLLVYSALISQHIQHLHQFFNCVKDAGLVLSLSKSVICTPTIEFLGITISFGKIELQSHVLQKLQEFTIPFTKRRQLQSFTGCLNWIAPFYPMIAKDLLQFKKEERSKEWFWDETLSRDL